MISRCRDIALAGLLLSSVCLMSACGEQSKSQLTSQDGKFVQDPEDAPGTPLLIFLGGYISCPWNSRTPANMSLHNRGTAFAEYVFQKVGVNGTKGRFLMSCFHRDPSKIQYYISDNPTKLITSSLNRLNDIIVDLAREMDRPDVYLVGHSYGGYSAMIAASSLPASIHIRSILTIDPISMTKCSPVTFIRSYLRLITGYKPIEGCIAAPPDIENSFGDIAHRVDHWMHFYQHNYGYLHSSDISHAGSSILMNRPAPWVKGYESHTEFPDDHRMWTTVHQAFDQDSF